MILEIKVESSTDEKDDEIVKVTVVESSWVQGEEKHRVFNLTPDEALNLSDELLDAAHQLIGLDEDDFEDDEDELFG